MSQKYFRPVLLISLVILIYQGIANSYLGILSEITHQNGNSWAGPLSTALLFTGSGFGSLYNRYIGKYKFRFCFLVGSFGYTVFVSLGLLFLKLGFSTTVQILLFVLSFLAGATCSIFYNTQFNYINFLSRIDQREVKYFGINMGLAQSSNIFGNLLSAMLIKPLGQFFSVLVMSVCMLVTSMMFLFASQPTKEEMASLHPKNQDNPTPPSANPNQPRPPEKVCSTFIFSGIIISFIYCILSIIIYRTFQQDMSDTELNHLTFILFIFEGVGEFLGGLAVIFLAGKIERVERVLPIVNSLFIGAVGVIYLGSLLGSVWVIGVGVVVVGFADCFSFSLSLTLAGQWKQAGISAFNIRQSLTVATTTILAVFISVQLCLLWIFIFYLWNAVGLFFYIKGKQNQTMTTAASTLTDSPST